MESGELRPDHGPRAAAPRRRARPWSRARPPLAAFNVELDSGDVELARAVAAGLRESGGGLPGVRAIGLALAGGRAQVSTNVHDPLAVPLARGGRAGAGAGGAARRRPARGRARRPRARGGAGRLSGGRADPRLRPRQCRRSSARLAAPPERRHSLDSAGMAQTKKKRRRKHRGTQGGRVDTNRRAARPRSREEAKAQGPRPPSQGNAHPESRQPADLAQLGHSAASSPPLIFAVLLLVIFKRPRRRRARPRRLHARLLHPGRLLHRHDDVAATRAGDRIARSASEGLVSLDVEHAHGRPDRRELLPLPPRGLRPRS